MRISMLTLGVALLMAAPVATADRCGFDGDVCCDTITAVLHNGNCVIPANNKYQFTLVRFGFENQAGQITWAGTQTTFNAASAAVGAAMGSFISNVTLPAGTYVAVRPEVSKDFVVNGSGRSTNDGAACTTGGDQNGDLIALIGVGLPACNVNPALDAGECNTGNNTILMRDTSLGNFTVDASTSRTITFSFDVGSGVSMIARDNGFAAPECVFDSMGPLDVSMSFN